MIYKKTPIRLEQASFEKLGNEPSSAIGPDQMKVKEEFERWAVYNLGQDFDCLLDESCHFVQPHLSMVRKDPDKS